MRGHLGGICCADQVRMPVVLSVQAPQAQCS